MPSLRRHLGELVIDHTASPGTPKVPEGTRLELAHFTCPHCSGVVLCNPQRVRPRNYCAKCDHWTCDTAGCVTDCHPIKRDAELAAAMPDANLPFMLRGPQGELLFDPALLDKTRVF